MLHIFLKKYVVKSRS